MAEYALAFRTSSAQLPRSRANELVKPSRPSRGRRSRTGPLSLAHVQPRLVVGPVNDPFEQEAERTARTVTQDQVPPSGLAAAPVAGSLLKLAQRALGKGESPARKDEDDKKKHAQKAPSAAGPAFVPEGVESGITRLSGTGAPLDATARSKLEPRFGFDFSDVRVHVGREAAGAALSLGARAFTVGRDIFFAAGEYQPGTASGLHLIAHELTHTIQQKPAAARAARLLAATSARVQRWEGPIDKIRNRVREFVANDFPPWDLITLVIGYDPIRDTPVKGSTRDTMRAAMKLVPEGLPLFERLDKEGKIDAVGKWWDGEVAKLDLSFDKMVALVERAWKALSLDVLDVVGAWTKKIKPIFLPVINRVWDFIKAVGIKILTFAKDVVLKQIGDWAKTQKGYPLLTMVLGRDPVTSEPVTPTLKGLIFAVLDIADESGKIKENLEKSKTVEKAAAWFKTEVKKLDLTWEGIKLLFSKAWDAFSVADLLKPAVLFEKMWAIFGPLVLRLFRFLGAAAEKVLEFVFEGAMLIAGPIGLQIVGIVRKIGSTFKKVINDPVTFVGHLVNAVKKGIQQFGQKIWEYLKTGLINWLVGTLEGAGLVLPKVWDLRGILDLVLQILGISYPKVRVKLVKVLGEKTVGLLEQAFAFVKTLVTEGPAAAWKEIVAAIGSLWDMVIGGIKDWAVTKIVTAAITKLATMFNPAGAVIQAVIATYNTVAFFIERIKQIVSLVEAIVDSIANIAEGKIAAAANWIEAAMARAIPVILGFLARLIGLGDVSGAIKKVITTIQEKVDKGIDAVIAWVVEKAKSLFGKGDDKPDALAIPDSKATKSVTMVSEGHTVKASIKAGQLTMTMASGEDTSLRELVRDALKDVDKLVASDELKQFYRAHLVDIQNRVDVKSLQSTYKNDGSPPGADAWLLKYVTNIIEQDLVPLAGHGIPSLTAFLNSIPAARFLPQEYRQEWIRWNLYVSPGAWDSLRPQIDARDRPVIVSQVRAANASRSQSAWDELRIAPDGKSGFKIPSWATLGNFQEAHALAQPMEVDHIEPIAKHWTKVGYNTSDKARELIGSGPKNLELVTPQYNHRKGSLGFEYRHDVDGNFESDMASSKKMSPKIKDRQFLRTVSGGPIF